MMLTELADYLADHGVGTPGTDLFETSMPPEPDDVVALYEYPGEPVRRTKGGPLYERPRVQVVCRSASYEAAKRLSERIVTLLEALDGRTLSGVWYERVRALQSPFPLDEDDSGRIRIATNYSVEKEPSTATG
jgi:hypothetical protein